MNSNLTSNYPKLESPSSLISQRSKLLCDIKEGLFSYHIWTILGWYDIRQRYRRSTIGPFWITISLAINVATLGFLYGKLFHQNMQSYLPYLTSGMVIWSLVSMVVNDSTLVFINAAGIIKQIHLPLSLHILRMITKNLIIFAHNFFVFLVVAILFHTGMNFSIFLFPVALFIWVVNALWVGLLLGALCARFRDVGQIVLSMVQILFFVTPVMWRPEALGQHAWLLKLNPLTQFFNILRDPLLGIVSDSFSWLYVLGTTALGWGFTILFFSNYRARVAYWV